MQYLTLTRVVFESRADLKTLYDREDLTLTRVVFE